MGGPLGDLKPYQQALDEAFERHGVVLAYLYGSQARGDAGPLSDVDVAGQFAPDLPRRERFSRVGRLIDDLCQLFRRDHVYVVDLEAIPPLLCHRIYLNHRLLCCPDDAVRVAFEIRALRQYVATRPLRRIRWRYVMRRISQGWYGRLESEAQTMVDVEVIQQRLGALEEFVSRLEEMRSRSLEEWQEDVVARYATERELEVAIQRVLNIATHVLTHLLLSCDLKGGNDLLAYYKFPGATTLPGQRRELDHQISSPSIVTVRPDEHISLR